MVKKTQKIWASAIVCAWAVFSIPAHAAVITILGSSFGVNYDVQYDDTNLGLYGTPSISILGKVEWSPPDFRASSSFGFCSTPFTGAPNCALSSELNVTLIAHTGFDFDGISMDEGGSYKLRGTSAFAGVGGQMDIFEAGTTFGAQETGAIVPNNAFDIVDDVFHPWTATAGADLTGVAWDGITSIDIVLFNTLETFTAPSSSDFAEIKKENLGAGVSLGIDMSVGAGANVPVPAAVWLFASGLLGLGGLARRKRQQTP